MTSRINFYSVRDPFGCFSNFSPHQISLGRKLWPTTEHYFQAQKFAGTSHEEDIRRAHRPSIAADYGRDRSRPLRPDWEEVKDAVMLDALRAKFSQWFGLSQVLQWTGNAVLVEHTANDKYWGDAGDGSGKNMLGVLLMQVRDELRNGKLAPNYVPADREDFISSSIQYKALAS